MRRHHYPYFLVSGVSALIVARLRASITDDYQAYPRQCWSLIKWGNGEMADHFRVAAVSYYRFTVAMLAAVQVVVLAACEDNDRTNDTVSGLVDLI